MPPKIARKRAPKATESNTTNPPISTITLGEEEPFRALATPDLSPTVGFSYPLRPLFSTPKRALQDTQEPAGPSNDTQSESQSNEELEVAVKDEKLSWTEEMMEQLVNTLYEVFEKGGAADNSFKKATFELAAENVRKAYKGTVKVTQQHCKNKWQDWKGKWAHWKVLGDQSGFGWNEESELYEAYDYVWNSLNLSHPGIIWHKTHVMPFRDSIGFILHDVQANGKGAFTLEEHTAIDPRLTALKTNSLSISPRASSAPPKTSYNKGKKRPVVEITDDTDEPANSLLKKVDLGVAISGLTREMEKARKAKEGHESSQQKAIKLLEKEYKARLEVGAFLKAIVLFKEEGNAVTFLTLNDGEYRDLWLEMETNSRLK
jgi:hypothetical protein